MTKELTRKLLDNAIEAQLELFDLGMINKDGPGRQPGIGRAHRRYCESNWTTALFL